MKEIDAPNSFWKYYDLYRRKKITFDKYSILANIPKKSLLYYLHSFGLENNKKVSEKRKG